MKSKTSKILRIFILSICLSFIGISGAALCAFAEDQPAESHFGYVNNVGSGGVPDDYFNVFDDVGFKWDRPHVGPFSWNIIEPEAPTIVGGQVQHTYTFKILDDYVRKVQERGLSILATIWPYTEWDQANWNAARATSMPGDDIMTSTRLKPYNMEYYKDFVRALVERYDGDGVDDMPDLKYPIKYWEVLNEPETGCMGGNQVMTDTEDVFFKGSADDYFAILKASYEAIKESDQDAIVLNGGAGGPAASQMLSVFYNRFFQLGGADYLDQWNFHNIIPSQETDLRTMSWINELVKYNKRPEKIWITECGAINSSSEAAQAAYIVKHHVDAFCEGVDKICYTGYMAPSGNDAPVDLYYAALIEANGRKKPSFYAMKTMIQKLDYFTTATMIHVPEDVYYPHISIKCAKFEFKDKNPVYVYWTEGRSGTVDVSINPGIGDYKLTDILGNSCIRYSNEPIIIANSTNVFFIEQCDYTWSARSLRKGEIITHLSHGYGNTKAVPGDYDGDGKCDYGIWDKTTYRWYILNIYGERIKWNIQWGFKDTIPVPADYNGDGKTDIAVYHPPTGNWYIAGINNNRPIQWGFNDTIPVPADYDGDGKTDLGVYYPPKGKWFIVSIHNRLNRLPAIAFGMNWGWSEAIPVPGDYDGDGKADLGVYHPATGRWFTVSIYNRANGLPAIAFGTRFGFQQAIPVPADYNGDGKDDIAVYYPEKARWYIAGIKGPITYGPRMQVAVPADYDGDGRDDLCVYGPKA